MKTKDAIKKERLKAIVELIRAEEINSQDLLVRKLEKKGFTADQSLVSRDLRALNIRKGQEGHYLLEDRAEREFLFGELVNHCKRSKMRFVTDDAPNIYLKMQDEYQNIISLHLERYLAFIGIEALIFNGVSGAMMIVIPGKGDFEQAKPEIQSILDSLN